MAFSKVFLVFSKAFVIDFYFYYSFRWFFMGWIYNMVGSVDIAVALLLLRRSDEIQSSIDGLFIEN